MYANRHYRTQNNHRDEGVGMSAGGPAHEKRPAGQSTVGQRGQVSLQMTAQDLISVAVNCRQNGWAYPDWLLNVLGCDSTRAVDAMRDEIYA